MTFTLKKTAPTPNGNPNFRKQWDNLGETQPVKLPKELHTLFKDIATAINSGKISAAELTAITGKPIIAPVPKDSTSKLIKKLSQFEDLQAQSWGKSSKQTGEFNTNSPRWQKYNEFKTWLTSQGE